MQTEKVKKYVEMTNRKKELAEEVKSLTAAMADLEVSILDDLTDEGIGSVKVSGRLVYIERKLWASPKANMKDQVCEVLRDLGHEDLVSETVNSNSLSALFREYESIGEEPPDELAELVNTYEKHSLRTRKA